jgi:Na+/melibiose symporter-like transporter
MGATHVGGVAFGLVAGGLVYSIWEPLPFVVAGVLVVVTTTVTLVAARRLGQSDDGSGTNAAGQDEEDARDGDAENDRDGADGGAEGDEEGNPHRYAAAVQDEDAAAGYDAERGQEGDSGEYEATKELAFWRDLAQRPDARRFLIGNVLWNAGVEGIRPYIFLFATVAIGITVATASLAMIGFMVAAGIGSVLVGHFGDRFGRPRVLALGALVAGLAMMPGLFIRDLLPLMILLVPAGIGAAALISLPYPVFEEMVEEKDVGRTTGVFYMSVGMARLIAPLLVGAAIDIGQTWMPETEGYPIMWPVAGSLILAGVVFLQLSLRAKKD